MSTIMYKCDSCNIEYLGSKEENFVEGHTKIVNADRVKWIKPYYICNNCKENDRKKYMEV